MASKHLWNSKLSANDASAKEQLGIYRSEWSTTDSAFKAYRYVQCASDTTLAAGTPCGYTGLIRNTVSTDVDDYDENHPAGVGIGALTASYYGWIQTGGYHATILTNGDDDIAAYDSIILDVDTDGVCDSVAAGTALVDMAFAVATTADIDGSDTVAGYLILDPVGL